MAEVTKRRIFPILRRYSLIEEGGSSLLVWVIGAYVGLIPSISLIPSLGPYNEKRVLQIGLLLIVGGILLASYSTRQQFLSTFYELPYLARWGIGVVLGLGILSSALAPSPFYAFLELSHFALLVASAGVIASVVRYAPVQTERVLLGVVALSALLYVVYFAVAYGMYWVLVDVKLWPEGGTNFANIRFFNQYQTLVLPILGVVVLAVPERWRTIRGLLFSILALWWTLVFAADVRGTVVGMAVAAASVAWLFRQRVYRWFGTQAAALLVGGGLYILLFYMGGGTTPQVAERLGDAGQYSRRLEWLVEAFQMATAQPWLGVGPMHFAWPPYHFVPGAHPHNALAQLLAEWGFPATTILVGLTFWGGWRWLQQETEGGFRQDDAVRVGLAAAVLAGGVHALVSGVIVMPLSQVLLVLVLGWAWGRYKHKSPIDSSPSFREHLVLCILLIASMAVIGSSLQDLTGIEERRNAYVEATDRYTLHPRYWTQGYLGIQEAEAIERAGRKQ